MAAPLASPGHRSRFEQEQDRAVRALVRSVTGLPEEELGGGRFQTALNFAWSNFRSVPTPLHPPLLYASGRSSSPAVSVSSREVPCGCWDVGRGRVLPYPPCRGPAGALGPFARRRAGGY